MGEGGDSAALRQALAGFGLGDVTRVEAFGGGHIHDTFAVDADGGRWLVQRFNERVFVDLDAVMGNIRRVTEHARAKLLARGVDPARRVLRLLPAADGGNYVRAADGLAYRAFEFVSGSRPAPQGAPDARLAFEAGRAFGEFVALLADLPAPPLAETIPGFHDTPARLAALRAAFQADPHGRAAALAAERAFVEERAELAGECASLAERGLLPRRVAHNDAKLDNLLLDAADGGALCAVDLDTVMPGYLAYDFGDLVRTAACTGREDTRDLSTIGLRLDNFAALARGYLDPLRHVIGEAERASLLDGAYWIVLELGMRFLTDHLQGDRYFKIARAAHNLDRARAQFQVLRVLERERPALQHAYAGG
jgi:Ser/Thr protein kinase RdoA (MazF antagonist)